jgi:hypothetical protein
MIVICLTEATIASLSLRHPYESVVFLLRQARVRSLRHGTRAAPVSVGARKLLSGAHDPTPSRENLIA